MAAQHEHAHYPAPPHSHRARRVPAPLVLLLVALAAILVPAALGTVAALGAPAFGAQNRAGASTPATHIHTQGQSVRNPRSRRDPNTPDSRIATGYFVGDEEAAALDEGERVAQDAVDASTPVGRRGNPIEVEPGTNVPGEINGRPYSGHAFDRMQGRGIPPSAVEDAITNGQASAGHDGATVYSGQNGVTVVVGGSGNVVTVR